MDDRLDRCELGYGALMDGAFHASVEAAVATLADCDDVRILRRVAVPEGRVWLTQTTSSRVAAAIDCETTGLTHGEDTVIELALRLFRYDELGRIVAIDRAHAWRQDPGHPLDKEITRLTGLTDDDLAGRSIDVAAATHLLSKCELVIAHNSAFDALFVEGTLPDAAGLPWGCSLDGVDWKALGFEGRALAWLLAQCGWFYRAHRAGDDVDALIELLRHKLSDGTTVLAQVIQSASRRGWRVRAEGAHFERRVVLKQRGYRFDGVRKVWWREVADDRLDEEMSWLDRELYAPEHRPRAPEASYEEVHARNRYRLN